MQWKSKGQHTSTALIIVRVLNANLGGIFYGYNLGVLNFA